MEAQTRLYNILKGNPGANYANATARGIARDRVSPISSQDDNWLVKKAKSVENAIGSTVAAPISLVNDAIQNKKTDDLLKSGQKSMEDVAKSFGYNSVNDAWDARDAIEASGDTNALQQFDNTIGAALKKQSNANMDAMKKNQQDYKDYLDNSYVGKKISKQDQGQFAGSALNTLSTMTDIMLPGAGLALNVVQGGVEGIADELERGGFKDFNWENARNNALAGMAGGLAGGLANKGISSNLAKKGGNLFKGNNFITEGINNLGSKTAAGRTISTLATGAGRGALAGAAGGAAGGATVAALNNEDVLNAALQGAGQGLRQGAVTGGAMSGINMAIDKAPILGDLQRNLSQAGEDWKNSGTNFSERLTNTMENNDTWGNRFLNNRVADVNAVADGLRNVGEGLGVLADRTGIPDIAKANVSDIANVMRGNGTETVLQEIMKNPQLRDQIIENINTAKNPLGEDVRNMKINNSTEIRNEITGDESMRRINDVRNGLSEVETIGKLPVDYMGKNSNMSDNIDYESRIVNQKIMAGNAKNLSVPELAYAVNNYTRSKIIEFDKNGSGRLNIIRPLSNGKAALIALEKHPSGNTLITTIRPDVDSNYIKNLTKNKNANVLYDTIDGAATASVTDNSAASRAMAGSTNNSVTQDGINVNRTPDDGVIDLSGAFENNVAAIQNKNRLQSMGQQLQNAANTQKFSAIYDSLDPKTARRAVETNAPQRLADLGVRPQDYNEYAKTSSYVNKVVSDLAEKSGIKVNAPDLPDKLNASNLDIILSDTALKKYNDYISKITPDGDSPAQYSASYLLKKSRELGNKAANLRGGTDDVRALRDALTDAKYTLRDLATSALEKSFITGDDTNSMIANGLKKLGANQKVIDYYAEAVDGKAPTVSDYIRRSALFEQGRDMGAQIEAEKYTRSASKMPQGMMSKLYAASGLEKPMETVLKSTVAPLASGITKLAGKAVEGAGNVLSGNRATNPQTELYNRLARQGTVEPRVTDINERTRLYDVIGREQGKMEAEQERTANYLADAVNDTNANNAATDIYNMAYGTPQAQTQTQAQAMPMQASQVQITSGSPFPQTGDYWTDIVGNAMYAAMQAGDVAAFGSLYGMYQDSLAKLEKQSGDNSQKIVADLSASQQTQLAKLDTAESAINELEALYDEAGGAQGLLGGTFAGWAGGLGLNSGAQTYEAMAEGLINQIAQAVGKTDSLNNEGEVKRALALVPRLTDTAQTAKRKLQALRSMLDSTRSSYSSAFGING